MIKFKNELADLLYKYSVVGHISTDDCNNTYALFISSKSSSAFEISGVDGIDYASVTAAEIEK
jgi:hypothetical protein